jgi:hypothetical protein
MLFCFLTPLTQVGNKALGGETFEPLLWKQSDIIQESSAGALGVLYLFMPGAK